MPVSLELSLPPLQIVVLVVLLISAAAIDIRERRIPNWLVASGMAAAIGFHTLMPQGEGAGFAFAGLAVGIATLVPIYALGLMGAGDVKLMGMTGAFLGAAGVLGAVLASTVAGGIFALAMAAGKRMVPQLLSNVCNTLIHYHISHMTRTRLVTVAPASSVGNMPYAVAITAGTLAQLTFLRY